MNMLKPLQSPRPKLQKKKQSLLAKQARSARLQHPQLWKRLRPAVGKTVLGKRFIRGGSRWEKAGVTKCLKVKPSDAPIAGSFGEGAQHAARLPFEEKQHARFLKSSRLRMQVMATTHQR